MSEQTPELSGNPATFRETPTSRPYVHKRCGGVTQVGDWAFEAICDPFYRTAGTICASCGHGYPLFDFTWADTGENVQAYRNRLAKLVTHGYVLKRRRLLIALMIVVACFAVAMMRTSEPGLKCS